MFCSKQMLSSCLQGKPSWVSRVVQQPRCICLQHAHTALGHAANAMCCRYGTSLSMPCTEHRHTQSRNPSYNLANPGQGSSPGQVGGSCRNRSCSPSADIGGPWDLSFTSYPGSAGLAWRLLLLCFLSPGPRHCYMCWQFYLLPCPSTISPGKLQRGEKVMSKIASLSLLTEDRYGLTVPFQRQKKKFISQRSVYVQLLPQTLSSPANSQHSRDQIGELVILSTIPMSWAQVIAQELSRVIAYHFNQDSIFQVFIRYEKHFHSSWLRR